MADTTNSFLKLLPRLLIALVVLGVAGWYGYREYVFATSHETTDNAQVETHLVPVLSRIAGYVQKVTVADYDTVAQGTLLVKIDPTEYTLTLTEQQADYHQSQVDVANAEASLTNARVALGVSEANYNLQKIRRDKALRDFKRDQGLFANRAITPKQLDDSENNYQSAEQQLIVNDKQRQLDVSRVPIQQTNLEKFRSVLAVKKARLAEQEFKISNTDVVAPESGRIGRKNVEPGQYVQPGQTLMTIAGDQTYWIVANFKETQIRRMHLGLPVDITLDAYPDVVIRGRIQSFSEATGSKFALLPPDNATGNFIKVTQRLPVKIAIDNPAKYLDKLKAGLSATVEVILNEP